MLKNSLWGHQPKYFILRYFTCYLIFKEITQSTSVGLSSSNYRGEKSKANLVAEVWMGLMCVRGLRRSIWSLLWDSGRTMQNIFSFCARKLFFQDYLDIPMLLNKVQMSCMRLMLQVYGKSNERFCEEIRGRGQWVMEEMGFMMSNI